MKHSEIDKSKNIKGQSNQQKQKQERINQYNKKPNKCLQCGQALNYKQRHNKFCNLSCAATYNNQKIYEKSCNNIPISYKNGTSNNHEIKREHGNCLYCGKPLKSRQKKYCSFNCETDYKYVQKIKQWKKGEYNGLNANGTVTNTLKRYLREKYHNSCAKCGWHELNEYTGKVPLEVHHINGDWSDNQEENLILLCPNCHSLTPTYKACNAGKGRKNRVNKKTTICNDMNLNLHETKPKKYLCKRCGKELKTHDAEYCIDCVRVFQRKVERPTKEELLKLIKTKSFVHIGKQFGVSDNTIRKWCKYYGLPYRKIDLK